MTRFTFYVFTFYALLILPLSCRRAEEKQVVLYTSVDEPVARPILAAYESRFHTHVILKTDAEATKTVGLAERIRAERDHPRCDVYWGNEVFNTVSLAADGLLAGYESATTRAIPLPYRDPGFRWAGTGLRARVLVLAPDAPKGAPHAHLTDLLNPLYKDRLALAYPTAGTTGGHVAALYALWGTDKADAFFRHLHDNGAKLLGGNSVVADSVASGQLLIGLTDNDDADNARLPATLPDQDSFGTLTMPTTVALVAGCPHRPQAEELLNYLMSPEVEQQLLAAHFAAYSVHPQSLNGAPTVRPMQIDYDHVAAIMPHAIQRATALLEGRQP